MTAVAFDTLRQARSLKEASFTDAQAEDAAEAIAVALQSDLATRSDLNTGLAVGRAELKEGLAALRTELKDEIAALRVEFAIRSSRSGRADAHALAFQVAIFAKLFLR